MSTPNNGRKTSPLVIASKERAAKALRLRKEGKTFPVIAKLCGYNHVSSAYDAVRRAIAEITREPAQELLTLELERLDLLWRPHWRPACTGNVRALNACLRIMDRRARLLGLYASMKQRRMPREPANGGGGVLVDPGMMNKWLK
jgi:hypothetical protein